MAGRTQPKPDSSSRWATESKKVSKTWSKARGAKAGGGYSNPEIEDGNYVARVIKAKADFTKGTKTNPSMPYVSLTLVVVDGDYAGTKLMRMDRLNDQDPERAAGAQERFAKTMDGIGYDCSELELSEVPKLIDSINKDKPFCHITVKNSTGDSGKEYLNVYCNKEATKEELENLDIASDAGEGEEGDLETSSATTTKKTSPKAGAKKASRGNARK